MTAHAHAARVLLPRWHARAAAQAKGWPLITASAAGLVSLMNAGEAPMPPDAVADIVVQALAQERFLILTQPQVAQWVQRKAADPERWVRGMRKSWRGTG